MDTTRKQVFSALEKITEQQPEMRFGRLVAFLALYARGPFASATYDVDDEELLDAANRHLNNLEKRRQAKTQVKELVAQQMKSAA